MNFCRQVSTRASWCRCVKTVTFNLGVTATLSWQSPLNYFYNKNRLDGS